MCVLRSESIYPQIANRIKAHKRVVVNGTVAASLVNVPRWVSQDRSVAPEWESVARNFPFLISLVCVHLTSHSDDLSWRPGVNIAFFSDVAIVTVPVMVATLRISVSGVV